MKCQPIPDDRSYKTIGLCRCPDCGERDCWPHYLSWEKHRGIKLNEDVWPAEDEWPERCRRSLDANPSPPSPPPPKVER